MYDLSIVIATKNEQNYIEETLRHLTLSMNEARKLNISTELIVIDSSVDHTLSIARKFTEKAHYLTLHGVSKARNYGAKLSKGRVLIFMDADTILQKNTLIDILDTFLDKSVISVIAFVLPTNYRELPSSAKLFYVIDKIFIKVCGIMPFLLRFYNRGDIVAIRKTIFNKIGGFNESLYMMEITELLVRASKYGRTKVLPTPVFESSRRLKKWGLLKSYTIWWKNYFAFYMLKRLHEATYEVVR